MSLDVSEERMGEGVNKRIQWIDCAKLCAIIAVLVDHCNGFLYSNPMIAQASYFSVSLFVLLSGITCWLSAERSGCSYIRQIKRVGKLLLQYAVGTLIILLWEQRFFDWSTYLTHLKNFSIQGPFYFFVFYIQLVAISPVLIRWCSFCNGRKLKVVWHLLTIVLLCFVCSLCINHTYILPVHGGGQFLFGGTYLLLYYLGILFASVKLFDLELGTKKWMLPVAMFGWLAWWIMMGRGMLPFDKMVTSYWGYGFNPPSIHFMVFAIITLFLLYALFSMLESVKWCSRVLSVLAFGGSNTLYIFMFHLLAKSVFVSIVPFVLKNVWIMRLTVFPAMIVLPVLGKVAMDVVCKKLKCVQ